MPFARDLPLMLSIPLAAAVVGVPVGAIDRALEAGDLTNIGYPRRQVAVAQLEKVYGITIDHPAYLAAIAALHVSNARYRRYYDRQRQLKREREAQRIEKALRHETQPA